MCKNITIEDIKKILFESCMLKVELDSIHHDTPLFSTEGLGLDSIDALQLVVAVEKKYGVTIPDAETAKSVLKDISSLRKWIQTEKNRINSE